MAPPMQEALPQAIPISQAFHLLDSFSHFLTVAIHNILFYRSLYPSQTFLTARAYNLPVHQSRHPKVCSWIRDAVDAIRAQLVLGVVEHIAIVVHSTDARVMERWMIDVGGFPAWKSIKEGKGKSVTRRDDYNDEDDDLEGQDTGDGKVNWTDVNEQLRAAIRRMADAAEKMSPLPNGCTFTVAVDLREEGDAPIGVGASVWSLN